MKYLLAIIKQPRSRAFALIAWDECNDIVKQRLGWLKIDASIYSRLTLRNLDDPITEECRDSLSLDQSSDETKGKKT